jgi:hypothetical protein
MYERGACVSVAAEMSWELTTRSLHSQGLFAGAAVLPSGRRSGVSSDAHRFTSSTSPRHGLPLPRSIVSALPVVLPLQRGNLGAITGRAQRGTFGAHEVAPLETLRGPCGAKQCTPTARAGPLPHAPAAGLARRARPPGEHGGHPAHEPQPHQGTAPGIAHQSNKDCEYLLLPYHRVPLDAAPASYCCIPLPYPSACVRRRSAQTAHASGAHALVLVLWSMDRSPWRGAGATDIPP